MMNEIRNILKDWYLKNKRSLPWRNNLSPYHIWLSEILLQQTQVKQAIPYFNKFIEKYPTVKNLALASEQQILKLWQGLGYYSRARNLHHSAKVITEKYNGNFPDNHKSLIELKGIGEYTACAILSIAYNKPYAVVDGNVYRILSRLSGNETPVDTSSGKKVFGSMAAELLDRDNPSDFNQTLMDFGALQCKKKPDCTICPLQNYCSAYLNNNVFMLPVKSSKPVVKNRYLHYLVIQNNNSFLLTKRSDKDIWKNLYDFPLIEYSGPEKLDFNSINNLFKPLNQVEELKCIYQTNHKLTHRNIIAKFYSISLEKPFKTMNFDREYLFVDLSKIEEYPFPKLFENFFNFILK